MADDAPKVTVVKTLVCGFYHWVDKNKNVYTYDPANVASLKFLGTLTSDFKINYKSVPN